MWETALANGQRSQWVGRFTRVRPSVPNPSWVAQAIGPHPCFGEVCGIAIDWVTDRSAAHGVRGHRAGSMYSQATVSAVLVVTGRLVNSVFWDSTRTCHLGLVPVETRLRLEDQSARLGPKTDLSQPAVRAVLRREGKSSPRTLCGRGRPTELVGARRSAPLKDGGAACTEPYTRRRTL